jgi:hypothetical protein
MHIFVPNENSEKKKKWNPEIPKPQFLLSMWTVHRDRNMTKLSYLRAACTHYYTRLPDLLINEHQCRTSEIYMWNHASGRIVSSWRVTRKEHLDTRKYVHNHKMENFVTCIYKFWSLFVTQVFIIHVQFRFCYVFLAVRSNTVSDTLLWKTNILSDNKVTWYSIGAR